MMGDLHCGFLASASYLDLVNSSHAPFLVWKDKCEQRGKRREKTLQTWAERLEKTVLGVLLINMVIVQRMPLRKYTDGTTEDCYSC